MSGSEHENSPAALRKNPAPSLKKVENEALALSEKISLVICKVKKLWALIDETREAGDNTLLSEKQLELRAHRDDLRTLYTEFKLLRSHDQWNVFDTTEYQSILVKEDFILHEIMCALAAPGGPPVDPQGLGVYDDKFNIAEFNVGKFSTDDKSDFNAEKPTVDTDKPVLNDNLLNTDKFPLRPSHPLQKAEPRREPHAAQSSTARYSGTDLINPLQQLFLRQHLPKVTPDVFSGEPTRFYAWRSSFRAMIEGTDLSAQQELVYLLQYTSGRPKTLVEAYRNRRMSPDQCSDLWEELRRRFGSPAVVANTYLEKLVKAASFKQGDRLALQVFFQIFAKMYFRRWRFYSVSTSLRRRQQSTASFLTTSRISGLRKSYGIPTITMALSGV